MMFEVNMVDVYVNGVDIFNKGTNKERSLIASLLERAATISQETIKLNEEEFKLLYPGKYKKELKKSLRVIQGGKK